jgi:uncharacterized protein YgbK (DUF1537 family)
VNGSLHPASRNQIAYARSNGCFGDEWRLFDEEPGGEVTERSLHVGRMVAKWLERTAAEGLIVFGGDTAFGIHHALGSEPFDPVGEIVPGVPLSRCGNLIWITKAGGFGEPDILCKIKRLL